MAQVLVIDDERSMREFLQIMLEQEGHEVLTAAAVDEGLERCREAAPELVFTDLKLPDGSGMEVLRWVREHQPDTQVIMMTAYATAENALEAMRIGAYDYQIKPFKVNEVRVLAQKALEKAQLLRENRELNAQLNGLLDESSIIGRSPKIAEVLAMIGKVGPSRANVLVQGESGTGKELVARAIHDASPRAASPFVPINCGAIPETLIEAELFGHVAGAFTGATKARPGLFEAAHGGTLLLDEVGELPLAMQVKLLRVIQDRSVRRVGEQQQRSVDVRLLASTNRDLEDMVRRGEFREDLFYRLNVVRINVPPLRERVEDIPLLARMFVDIYAKQLGKPVNKIAPSAMRALTAYSFPGNVRELENTIERGVTLASSDVLELGDLPEEIVGADAAEGRPSVALPPDGIQLEQVLQDVERSYIERALELSGGVKTKAAELLGLTFRSFRYRLHKLGIELGSDGDA